MKTVFLIAGFDLSNTASDEKYTALREGLSAKGYRVCPAPISWKRKTFKHYCAEFEAFYNENKSDYNIVAGNSFGAVVALLTAGLARPDEIFLCSLSPFFLGDKHFKPDSYFINYFGSRRINELRSTNFQIFADQINQSKIKTTITYGQREHTTSPPLVRRAKIASEKLTNSRLVELEGAGHSMSESIYTSELLKLF